MFKLFKKTRVTEVVEIDESTISEIKRPKVVQVEQKNYRVKSIDWLEQHYIVVSEVASGKKTGARQQGKFTFEGRQIYKDDVTRKLYSDLLDNYSYYAMTVKRYIVVRKELEIIDKQKDEEYLIAGRAKEFNLEASRLENALNVYLTNINVIKNKIKDYLYS
ncbi:hypothetical protein GW835_03025 [archaeon]|nr:hypothetical protein [archaeon]NCP79510.1 hypothetical protein [archaeon]NCP97453.1 hypothetical protein [archaeon]NCQ07277.1 hypothetical protein [archaeon]NCQ51073.1 hypothetical protein [archaeon]